MYRRIPHRRSFSWVDLVVVASLAVLIYGLVGLAQRWMGAYHASEAIDLAPGMLPRYALFSLSRALASYALSLTFTLVYGYIAAKVARAERVMIPVLDILQAVPVLGFMPGLVLGLVSLFPNSNIGIELTCIIMIFTGQAWNMTFSFYQSMKTVPSDLQDASRVLRLSWWQRFRRIELPFSAIGLAWNSLMSFAGGWFFLTVCESFTLGNQHFRVPGIGSYMATAIDEGNAPAMLYGLATMFLLIVSVDFLVWRPIMAWVRKFQMEEIQEEQSDLPFITAMIRQSFILGGFPEWIARRLKAVGKRRKRHRAQRAQASHPQFETLLPRLQHRLHDVRDRVIRQRHFVGMVLLKLLPPLSILVCVWGGIRLWELVRTLTVHDWKVIWGSAGLTFSRVLVAVLVSSLWAIPVGFWIGLSPRLTRIFQPVVQIAASFPMPMLFPLVTAAMLKMGMTIHWGSAVLMMLGVQWYILFNVLAGAMVVSRDLKDAMVMMGTRKWTLWWKLYLPSAFPALVTGWMTAAGGAWNASIVAEFVHYGDKTLAAPGLGSMITRATMEANFPKLAGCLIAMVVTVVGLNQTWWRWLGDLAETKFRFEK